METRKILIDCDTGTDDAIAIAAALHCPEVEVVGFTTVDGNVALRYTAKNTLDLVRHLGFETPVAVGADAPLKRHVVVHEPDGTHGNTGMGNIALPDSGASFHERSAVELIANEAKQANGALEIVAIGPLTNIGIAFLLYPELKQQIKHIFIMGGAVIGGNMTTTAEFNIWADPEAARLVFASGVPLTMVGLDVTEEAVLDESDARKMRALQTPAGDVVADLLEYMFVRRDAGGEDAQMHDALALAAAVCPECLVFEEYYVDVECEGTYTFGHTFVDINGMLKRPPNARVAIGLRLEIFRDWLYNCVANCKPGGGS